MICENGLLKYTDQYQIKLVFTEPLHSIQCSLLSLQDFTLLFSFTQATTDKPMGYFSDAV